MRREVGEHGDPIRAAIRSCRATTTCKVHGNVSDGQEVRLLMSAAKTNAQRQAAFSQRLKSSGMVRLVIWVHSEDSAAVRKYAACLAKCRRSHIQRTASNVADHARGQVSRIIIDN